MNEELDKKRMGSILKAHREDRGLNKSEAAVLINTTQATWSNLEHGRFFPTTFNLIAICKAFNLSADYLLGLSE